MAILDGVGWRESIRLHEYKSSGFYHVDTWLTKQKMGEDDFLSLNDRVTHASEAPASVN